MFKADYIEWNDPFDGCTDREQLLLELQREYNDAIHDWGQERLQERTTMGTHQKEEQS
jgi:hypothetical protein